MRINSSASQRLGGWAVEWLSGYSYYFWSCVILFWSCFIRIKRLTSDNLNPDPKFPKFHRISLNFTKFPTFPKISPNFTKSLQISPNFPKFPQTPPSLLMEAASHQNPNPDQYFGVARTSKSQPWSLFWRRANIKTLTLIPNFHNFAEFSQISNISQIFLNFSQISPNFTKFHQISPNFPKLLQTSPNLLREAASQPSKP